ncbi:protein white-like [Sycon ciliatum]|uniref:protein white-like n=1 Tax=Sycon ciliatum TaxID=27933 RepID=UPI0031F69A60
MSRKRLKTISCIPPWSRPAPGSIREAIDSDINFSWHGVSVQVPEQPRKGLPAKVILDSINGEVKAGSLLAIMGASGAGKTTFLNLLTDRTASGLQVNAVLAINNNAIKPSDVRKISSYVQQQDLFFSSLTVLEHLTVQALLRMNRELSRKERLQRAQDVLHELGLSDVVNSYIGSVFGRSRGISGGQRKRLSFATEVLTDPPLLFVDEPTTGLDSFAAETVVRHLKNMSEKGRTVLCTIHQPATEVFNCFDELLLLAEGRTAYLGARSDAVAYFSNIGYACPHDFNPADFYIYTLAVVPTEKERTLKQIKQITDKYREVEESSGITERMIPKPSVQVMETVKSLGDQYGETVFTQLSVLSRRTLRLTLRNMIMIHLNVMATVVVCVAMGLFYLNIGSHEDIVRRVQGVTGAIFLLIAVFSYHGAGNIAQIVPVEHPIFVREYESGTYSPAVYFICKYLATLPVVLMLQLGATSITYFMFGLAASAKRYFIFYAANVMVMLCAESIGYIISAVAGSNLSVAFALTPVGIVPLMLFGGVLLNLNSTPDYVVWLEAISFLRWGFEVAMVNEFQEEFLQNCTGVNPTQLCFNNGSQVLERFGLDTGVSSIGRNFGILAALIVGYRLIAFTITIILLRIRVKR